MGAIQPHAARATHIVWMAALTISAVVFLLSLAVLVGAHFHDPAAPQASHPQRQRMRLALSTIRATWPDRVEVGSSAVIAVSLQNRGKPSQSQCPATPTLGGSEQSPIRIIGKPGVPLADAFGSSYEGYATAHLDAIGFDVVPSSTDAEALNQPRIDWAWSIAPKESGQQYALIRITGTWQTCFGGPAIERQIWTSRPIRIVVDQPFLQRNSFDLVGFITGTAGASSILLICLRLLWHVLERFWTWVRPSNKAPERD